MTGQLIVFLLAVAATPALAVEPVSSGEDTPIVVIGNRGAPRADDHDRCVFAT